MRDAGQKGIDMRSANVGKDKSDHSWKIALVPLEHHRYFMLFALSPALPMMTR